MTGVAVSGWSRPVAGSTSSSSTSAAAPATAAISQPRLVGQRRRTSGAARARAGNM